MYRPFIVFFLYMIAFILAIPVAGMPRYHCPDDTARAERLIESVKGQDNFGKRIVEAARFLVGTPEAKGADNDSIGTLVVRLDSLSRREFINIALAMAKASERGDVKLSDFETALENIGRKKGKDEGFVSQFFYGADWIQDNISRGNLKEMTDYVDGGSFKTKSFDYVTRHREEFPAMADSATYDKMRSIEMGFRSHRIPYQKKQSIGNNNIRELLKDGDIIMMLTPDDDFDIYDIGVVAINNGQPHLIHISHHTGKVVEDEYDLKRLFKVDGQYFYGYRWLRPME